MRVCAIGGQSERIVKSSVRRSRAVWVLAWIYRYSRWETDTFGQSLPIKLPMKRLWDYLLLGVGVCVIGFFLFALASCVLSDLTHAFLKLWRSE